MTPRCARVCARNKSTWLKTTRTAVEVVNDRSVGASGTVPGGTDERKKMKASVIGIEETASERERERESDRGVGG